jgi:hypothetical protein
VFFGWIRLDNAGKTKGLIKLSFIAHFETGAIYKAHFVKSGL